jgi:hypothetical protein
MYYSVQQLLLTESLTLYIIVVALASEVGSGWSLDDPLTCDEDLKYSMTHRQNLIFWLNTIFSLAPGAKIIVVCTKIDRLSEDVRQQRIADVKECVKRTLAYARGRIAGVLPVSSKTGKGFDALHSKIEQLRPTLDRYGEPVPACWFKFLSIAQELVKQGLQRISYNEAQQIARQCGVHVENDVRAMLQRFNDAGLLCIAAFVAPEESVRQKAVERIGRERALVVHLACPLEVCRQRDAEGHYALADAGEMKHFPGVSALYEAPGNPDLVLPTDQWSVTKCVDALLKLLGDRGAI